MNLAYATLKRLTSNRLSKMKISIVGAGMSGLLCANMLRRHEITVYERQLCLPNNHAATLRFRSPNVGDVLGIQFKKVRMLKTYEPYQNVVADSLSYSKKCTGIYKSDRSIIEGTYTEERYIAPSNLIELMAKDINIKYGSNYNFRTSNLFTISTIPMPMLMKILDYPHIISFENIPGIVLTATIKDCDAYVSVLFPGPQPFSRATITGDKLIVEFPNKKFIDTNDVLLEVYHHLGLTEVVSSDVTVKKQEYFKIVEMNENERKKFQRWATVHYNIFSLGRYATWRPKLLLDDLIGDVKKIEGWITGE
jgi:NAD(P)-binding Rossmann-like domain